jgi:hypothetical protein
MNQQLISACQMFLVPASILFAAIGVANTVQVKTFVSLMGLITSLIWIISISIWGGLEPTDRGLTLSLAAVFLASWIVAFVAHLCLWKTEWRICKKLLPSWERDKVAPPQIVSPHTGHEA